MQNNTKDITIRFIIITIFLIIIVRLFYIQIIDNSYKESADNNALRKIIQHAPRGEVLDRNGVFLAQSRESYDLMVIPRDVKPFDTILLSNILGVTTEELRKGLIKARSEGYRRPSILLKQLSKEVKLKFEEQRFPGFYTQYRTVRSYPYHTAGNILGYVGEVNSNVMKRDPYYRRGDYIGMTGIESAYEDHLRGQNGVKIEMIDVHGMPKGSYKNEQFDTLAVPGTIITSTIDAELQLLGEELMQGKIGSVIAIEPSTGEILAMVSSPTYNPDLLIGRDRSKNYADLINDPRRPLYNRAVMSANPPGSTFKMATGLIGLQEEVLLPSHTFSCGNGYSVGRFFMRCHPHGSPLALKEAIGTSCNAYFCNVFRRVLDNPRVGNTKDGFDIWRDHVLSFGFGRKLDSDFKGEQRGSLPTREQYDNRYRNSWNSVTVISLSIGQGELGVTPLQLANFTATIANKGYYYIPHIIKNIEGRDSIDNRFYEKQYTKVDPKHFDIMVDAMWEVVNGSGTGRAAAVPGLDICGKTGTAQNVPGYENHSTFVAFAPKNNPKIAISVYVEHGGYGAATALPVASLMIEKYLTDTIKRPHVVDNIKNKVINYPMYVNKQKK